MLLGFAFGFLQCAFGFGIYDSHTMLFPFRLYFVEPCRVLSMLTLTTTIVSALARCQMSPQSARELTLVSQRF